MLRGGSEALPSSFLVAGPDVFFFFVSLLVVITETGKQRKRHSLWSRVALDSSLTSIIHTFVLWTKLLSPSKHHFLASEIGIMSSSHFSFFLSSSFL